MQNRIKLLALAVTCVLGMAATATAQNFPSRPITIVVPFAAGGPTDTVARIVAEHMRTSLGQPLIVENVVGASGTVGTGRVARAVPDGHTVIVGFWGTHVLNGALFTLQYDVLKDFAPIALLATNPQLIVARNALPPTDLNELIAWLKANPGKASQGTAGVGSPAHVGGVFFSEHDPHTVSIRPLFAWRCPGHAGFDCRTDRPDVRPNLALAPACAQWQHQSVCRHRRRTPAIRTRNSNRR